MPMRKHISVNNEETGKYRFYRLDVKSLKIQCLCLHTRVVTIQKHGAGGTHWLQECTHLQMETEEQERKTWPTLNDLFPLCHFLLNRSITPIAGVQMLVQWVSKWGNECTCQQLLSTIQVRMAYAFISITGTCPLGFKLQVLSQLNHSAVQRSHQVLVFSSSLPYFSKWHHQSLSCT